MDLMTDKDVKESGIMLGILGVLALAVFLFVFGAIRFYGTSKAIKVEPLVTVSTGLECDTVTVGSQWVWTNDDPFAETVGDITSVTIEVIEIKDGYALTQYIEPKRKYLSSKGLNEFGRYKKVGCE